MLPLWVGFSGLNSLDPFWQIFHHGLVWLKFPKIFKVDLEIKVPF